MILFHDAKLKLMDDMPYSNLGLSLYPTYRFRKHMDATRARSEEYKLGGLQVNMPWTAPKNKHRNIEMTN